MYLIRGEPTTPRAAVRPMSTEYDPVPGHRGGRDRVGAELMYVASRRSPVRGRVPPGRPCGRWWGHGNTGAAVSGSGWRVSATGTTVGGRGFACALPRRPVPGPGVCQGGAGRGEVPAPVLAEPPPPPSRAPPHPALHRPVEPRPTRYRPVLRPDSRVPLHGPGGPVVVGRKPRPARAVNDQAGVGSSAWVRPCGSLAQESCRSASTTYGHPLPGELLSNHPHSHLFTLRTVEALHKAWRAGWSPSPRSPSTPESRRAR